MKPSRYFRESLNAYQAELDDLRWDSDQRNVLNRRLEDKRAAYGALLPMIELAPEMVAPVFHRAFTFPDSGARVLDTLLARTPEDFPAWGELAASVRIADWALPLIALTLDAPQGECFLSTALGLEYALQRRGAEPEPASVDRSLRDSSGEDDDDDASDATDDFLEQQGFDRRGAD